MSDRDSETKSISNAEPTKDALREAETEKLRAEREKYLLEAEQLRKEIERGFFQKKWVLQAIIGGVVGVTVLWFYVVEVGLPLMRIEQMDIHHESRVMRDSLYASSKRQGERERQFAAERRRWDAQRADLNAELRKMALDYEEMSRSSEANAVARDRYARRADSLRSVLQTRPVARNRSGVPLSAGWNAFIYHGPAPVPTNVAFAPIRQSLALVKDSTGAVYIPEYTMDEIRQIRPGSLYLVNVDEDVFYPYPFEWGTVTVGDPDDFR